MIDQIVQLLRKYDYEILNLNITHIIFAIGPKGSCHILLEQDYLCFGFDNGYQSIIYYADPEFERLFIQQITTAKTNHE